jgi:hypothetical protein
LSRVISPSQAALLRLALATAAAAHPLAEADAADDSLIAARQGSGGTAAGEMGATAGAVGAAGVIAVACGGVGEGGEGSWGGNGGGGSNCGGEGLAPSASPVPSLSSLEAPILPAFERMLSRLCHLNHLATANSPPTLDAPGRAPTPEQEAAARRPPLEPEAGSRRPPPAPEARRSGVVEEEMVAVSTALQAVSCWVGSRRWLSRLLSERPEQVGG